MQLCCLQVCMHVVTLSSFFFLLSIYRRGNWCGDCQWAPGEDTDPIQLTKTSQQFSLCPLLPAHLSVSFNATDKEASLSRQATPENQIDGGGHHGIGRRTEEGVAQHTREETKERFEVQLSATPRAGARTRGQPEGTKGHHPSQGCRVHQVYPGTRREARTGVREGEETRGQASTEVGVSKINARVQLKGDYMPSLPREIFRWNFFCLIFLEV